MRRWVFATALGCSLLVPAGGAGHPSSFVEAVDIAQFAYEPDAVTVPVGATVNWTWRGPDTNHSVTVDADQGEEFDSDPDGAPGLTTHAVDDNFTHTFEKKGHFIYHCKNHSFMVGHVHVVPPPDSTPPRIRSLTVSCAGKGCSSPSVTTVVNERSVLEGRIERRRGSRWATVRQSVSLPLKKGRSRGTLRVGRLGRGEYRLVARAHDETPNYSKRRVAPFTSR